MIKLIGAIAVILASTWVGFRKARSFAERPKEIRQLRSALSLLETEIGYGSRPLGTACYQISERYQGSIAKIFRACYERLEELDGASTYECLKQAIESHWDQTFMKQGEMQIMIDLSKTLGGTDRKTQIDHVNLAKINLEVEEQKAREEQAQYEKMYRTLGLLFGTLIIILMY